MSIMRRHTGFIYCRISAQMNGNNPKEITMTTIVVGNWRLDEGTGQVARDSSGNENHGQRSPNAPLWIGGRKPASTAPQFDGQNSVKVASDPRLTVLEPLTVTAEAWVRSCNPGTLAYILSKGGEACVASSYAIYTGESGGLYFYIRHNAALPYPFTLSPDAGTSVWNGRWHHVVGTYGWADRQTIRRWSRDWDRYHAPNAH